MRGGGMRCPCFSPATERTGRRWARHLRRFTFFCETPALQGRERGGGFGQRGTRGQESSRVRGCLRLRIELLEGFERTHGVAVGRSRVERDGRAQGVSQDRKSKRLT